MVEFAAAIIVLAVVVWVISGDYPQDEKNKW